jgi:hypothetical protein
MVDELFLEGFRRFHDSYLIGLGFLKVLGGFRRLNVCNEHPT